MRAMQPLPQTCWPVGPISTMVKPRPCRSKTCSMPSMVGAPRRPYRRAFSLGIDGRTLTVDPADPAFDYLAFGQQSLIVVTYDVEDAQGATVPQTPDRHHPWHQRCGGHQLRWSPAMSPKTSGSSTPSSSTRRLAHHRRRGRRPGHVRSAGGDCRQQRLWQLYARRRWHLDLHRRQHAGGDPSSSAPTVIRRQLHRSFMRRLRGRIGHRHHPRHQRVPPSAGVVAGDVTEDVAFANVGLINATGRSPLATRMKARQLRRAGGDCSNGHGTFTLAADGTWTYSADNTQAEIQQLGASQFLTDSFTAHSFDGTAGQTSPSPSTAPPNISWSPDCRTRRDNAAKQEGSWTPENRLQHQISAIWERTLVRSEEVGTTPGIQCLTSKCGQEGPLTRNSLGRRPHPPDFNHGVEGRVPPRSPMKSGAP